MVGRSLCATLVAGSEGRASRTEVVNTVDQWWTQLLCRFQLISVKRVDRARDIWGTAAGLLPL
jgi:hypothetical protein